MNKEELENDIEHHETALQNIHSKWCDFSKHKQAEMHPRMTDCINRLNWAKNELRLLLGK